MPKYRWTARMGHRVGGAAARYRGRQPISLQPQVADAIMQTGVFSRNPDGTIYYSGPAGIRLADGTKAPVGSDGIVELDTATIHPDLLAQGVLNDLADPDEPLPPPQFTEGYDDTPPASLVRQK